MKRLNLNNINTPDFFDKIFERNILARGMNYIDKLLFETMCKKFKGGRFLDLGCLDSIICPELKKHFQDSEFWGLDFAPKTIKYLRKHYPAINYICANALDTPFRNDYFDYIVAGELLEHMEDPEELLKEIFRILKPGGIFSFNTPLEEDVTRPCIAPEHIWAFTKKDIEKLLKQFGKSEIFIIRQQNREYITGYCQKIISSFCCTKII